MSSEPSRSSPDRVDAAIEHGVDRILDLVGDRASPVVLVDGRSGSGKTTLTARLAARWGGEVEVVALDDLYPGWDGLDAGVDEALRGILEPRARGDAASWRRWDWDAGAWAETHTVPPAGPLVVEGAGILTPHTAPLADVAVWLESPDAARKARALARDGELYRPHWDRWAAQEERHLDRDRPRGLAILRVTVP